MSKDRGFDLYIIADYGPEDPAFTEVNARLRGANRNFSEAIGRRVVDSIDRVAVPPFSTISTGFWIRQIGKENGYPGAVIFSNTAPRGDKEAITWEGDERQRLLYGRLNNGVQVFAVSTGHNWSFVRDELREFRDLDIPNSGSQFRSRDIYAPLVIRFLSGERFELGRELDPSQLPEVPTDRYVEDGYGNLKLTTRESQFSPNLRRHQFLAVTIGEHTKIVHNHLAGQKAPVGQIGLLVGSSGPQEDRYLELIKRGGSAKAAFGNPTIWDQARPVEFSSV